MNLHRLESKTELEQWIQTGVAFVVFEAPWCSPCLSQEPIADFLARRFEDLAAFGKIDIDAIPDTAKRLGIQALPTIIIYRNGKEIQRFTGVHEGAVLESALINTLGHRPGKDAPQTNINGKEQAMNEDKRQDATTETHKPARPLKYFKDRNGDGWLCDKNIDPKEDLRAQGCWRCDEMAFPMGGR